MYKLVAEDTVEEKVLDMQRNKAAIAQALFNGGENQTKVNQLDSESLLALFQ